MQIEQPTDGVHEYHTQQAIAQVPQIPRPYAFGSTAISQLPKDGIDAIPHAPEYCAPETISHAKCHCSIRGCKKIRLLRHNQPENDDRRSKASSEVITSMRKVKQTVTKIWVSIVDRNLQHALYSLQNDRFTENEPAPLSHPKHGYGSYLVKILTLFAIYFVTARLGLSLNAVSQFATLIWLPSGIALAALFLFGYRLWPAIMLGAFLVNLFNGAPLLVAVGIALGNTLEALVGTFLLKRTGVRSVFDHLRCVLFLVLLAMPLSASLSATIGVSSLFLGKVIAFSAYSLTWRAWWVGDMISILILTPFLLTWSTWTPTHVSGKRLAEIGILTVVVLAVGLVVFLGSLYMDQSHDSLKYLVFPPLIWAALRFGPRGAISAVCALSVLAIVGSLQGVAPFSPDRLSERLLFLQLYMGTIAATAMILAAITAERSELERHKQEYILALATTDPITALPNQRALLTQFEQELKRAQRYDHACSLLFVDLDHFKALNDGYGHASGDAVLCEFARLVHSQLRGIDMLGRWGGEEFAVILPEVQVEEARHVAEAVRTAVAVHTFQVAGGIHLTCSIGLASSPLHAQAHDDLFRAADQAMYAAKHFGRNQVHAAHDAAVRALFSAGPPESGREEVALVGVTEALVALIQARDQVTDFHCQHVADLTHQLALALGWPAAEAQMLTLAGRLHDLGKVAVPDSILQKQGRLTSQERALMQQHAVVGAEIVSHIPALRPLAPLIRAHHERWDGRGYPDQLAGEAIPIGARILTVADAYQAMHTDRSYQRACAPADALRELRRCAGSQFDPQVVSVLLRLLGEPGEEVEEGPA